MHCEGYESFLPPTHTATKNNDEVLMLQNAQDVRIKDSSFTLNVGTAQQDGAIEFLKSACLNAILNAGGRADEVRCYPGTREEVIGKVKKWRDGHGEANHRMLWLSGHAGAGKSAIAQTVAERGRESGVHAANFFFFRGDHTRNHAQSLVATFIYQLIDFYPALREHLTAILSVKPLAHTASVGEQFTQLLASPIENIRHSSSIAQDIILIIDGLDECGDEDVQLQILSALHALVSRDRSPFRVFVASRAEPHLVMFFNKIAGSVESLFLSDEYRPADDIRKFVAAKFEVIQRTHHLAYTLSENWFTEADINKITEKSSGQFIFAATVMRFIEHSRDSPLLSLLTVHQLRPPTNHRPFALLDALYSHVFAKARDIRAIKWALGFHSMHESSLVYYILHIAGYETINLRSLFADISAIANVSIDNESGVIAVYFYHASLPDYLRDQSRSEIYRLDEEAIAVDAAAVCLQKFCDMDSFGYISYVLKLYVKNPTEELSTSLLDAPKRKLGQFFKRSGVWDEFICTIIRLYFTTNKDLCTRILRGWIHFAYVHKFDPALRKGNRPANAGFIHYEFLRLSEKPAFWRRFR